MKPPVSASPPPSLVAYELESGTVLFIHDLQRVSRLPVLSAAEHDVLVLLLDGHDTRGISDARGTSPRTTANQVASIFKKLGVGSRAELAAKVLTTHRR